MKRSRFSQSSSFLFFAAMSIGVVAFFLALADEVFARVGGGHSYGGGSRGGGGGSGGSGDGGAIAYLLFQAIRFLVYLTIEYPVVGIPLDIIIIGAVVYYFRRRARMDKVPYSFTPSLDRGPENFSRDLQRLRRFDPNFSEIVFTDFCYTLYARAHDARGRGVQALDELSPYLSDSARKSLLQRNPPALQEVKGIIVGAMQGVEVRGLDTPVVNIGLLFETNYTEVVKNNGQPIEMTYYVRERWNLERKRDIQSLPPARATALHCPRCGAPLQKDTNGACAFCGTRIESGEFQWYVREITLLDRQARGPLLTSDVPEVGTNYPSVVQPNFEVVRMEFEKNHPGFSWGEFQARARLIFNELQTAWSTLKWEQARPHETDNLFQMHRYWIEAYKRQHLRNVLDRATITAMHPVKIMQDSFYNSITLRISAQGYDYTVDDEGNIVSGSNTSLRSWSEYWTFIRSRNAKPAPARADLNCPNCGAPLKVNAVGICEFCGGKITSGEFDWVLSRIEQDESYKG